MPTGDEAKAAQCRLDDAVTEFLRAMGWGQGMITTGWALVAHQAGFNDEGEDTSGYPVVYQGGSMADHAAIGLFQVGIDTVRGVGRWDKE